MKQGRNMREKLWREKERKGSRAQLGLKNLGIWKLRKRKRRRNEGKDRRTNSRKIFQIRHDLLWDLQSDSKYATKLGWTNTILFWKRGSIHQTLAGKTSLASIALLESAPEKCYWGRISIDTLLLILTILNHSSAIINPMLAQSNGRDCMENFNSLLNWLTQLTIEACPVYCWRSQDLGEYLSSSFKFSYMHWWLMLWFNHFYQLKLPIYTFTWRWLFICLQVHQFSHC